MINFTKSLAKLKVNNEIHRSVSSILKAALDAADPIEVVEKNLKLDENQLQVADKTFLLYPDSRIILIAIGKAALDMAKGAIEVLGDQIKGGVVVCKHNLDGISSLGQIKVLLGSHPVPDQRSIDAAFQIRKALTDTTSRDVVLLLVSGGGSALVCLPAPGVTLQDIQEVTTTLLRSGASINELNAVRKHLDLIKGGGLLKMAAPAPVGALVISDVVNNPLDVIASGPAVPDPSTFMDASKILENFAGLHNIPEPVRVRIETGCRGEIEDTLKPGDALSSSAAHTIVASNQISAEAALEAALKTGFNAEIIGCGLIGEARQAGVYLAGLLKTKRAEKQPYLGIVGGETTVKVTGKGLGGRNLEVALGAVAEISGIKNCLLITLATDGEDGPTNAAGAFVTGETLSAAHQLGLDPDVFLNNNDAYHFFEKTGGLILTGPSGTNVNDLNFIFRFPEG